MTRKLGIGVRVPLLVGLALAVAVFALPNGGRSVDTAHAQPATPHYVCHNIVPGQNPGVAVNLETQFGVEVGVVVGNSTYLCPPAAKDSPTIPNVPHLMCYGIDEPPPHPDPIVNLTTQFGVEENVVIGGAKQLCVPANKSLDPNIPPPPPDPNSAHYKCYEIDGHDPDVNPVVEDQFFGPEPVEVGKATLFCASALKNGEGDLGATDLKCYSIARPGPYPNVSVTDQFGPKVQQQIFTADFLCAPALKEIVGYYSGGVGGVAELPLGDADTANDAAPAPSDGSGLSTGAWAGIVAGAAVLVLVLAGGGLYASRRRIR